MLTIRFNRVGKKNKAYFRIVLQEHTIAPGGRHIEVLGSWDPHMKKAVLEAEKIKEWIKKGAQVSDTAYNLFIKEGVLTGKKRVVKVPKKKVEPASAEATAGEGSKPEEKKEEPKAEDKVEEIKPEEPKKEEVKVEEPKAEPVSAEAIAGEGSKTEEVKTK